MIASSKLTKSAYYTNPTVKAAINRVHGIASMPKPICKQAIGWSLHAYGIIPEDANSDDNHDIDDYLGIADLELMYPWKEHTFKILLRNNFHREDNRGAVQADWTFQEKNLFGYIQLYNGYAESLIDYNKRSDRVSIGFALSR